VTVRLNHTIVASRDKEAAALFLSELLDLPAPVLLGPFAMVQVGETSLDFVDAGGEPVEQHYAFLVSEREFDDILARIRARRLAYWSDPSRGDPGRINTWDDGRGVYFDDPSGHLLEILTRPYGSGGTDAAEPHPLIAPRLEPERERDGEVPRGKADGGQRASERDGG
jgi:catechol 2,3-dioxygenase-like lactoylglutathione lyase family enzyme